MSRIGNEPASIGSWLRHTRDERNHAGSGGPRRHENPAQGGVVTRRLISPANYRFPRRIRPVRADVSRLPQRIPNPFGVCAEFCLVFWRRFRFAASARSFGVKSR
jgi:hypothetical protein